jgi:hypothetical protein
VQQIVSEIKQFMLFVLTNVTIGSAVFRMHLVLYREDGGCACNSSAGRNVLHFIEEEHCISSEAVRERTQFAKGKQWQYKSRNY